MFESLLSLLIAGSLNSTPSFSNVTLQGFDESSLLSVAPLPHKVEEDLPLGSMSATAVIAIDIESQTVLFQKNSDLQLPIASITKLMTAYIILEEHHPDELVTVSANAAATPGSRMGLRNGEIITIQDLLYGLLMPSGNDAAIALAEHNAGSEAAFVVKMNDYAKKMGLISTHYSNATGLDDVGAYSSARDQGLLSAYLVRQPSVREIVGHKELLVVSVSGIEHPLKSTNILLGEYGVKGLKTGKTPEAKENLATLAESPDGHEIVTIVLGSENRFGDTKVFLDWLYRAFMW